MDAITPRPYVLGHSDTELRRLAMQSAFWGELTEEVFQRAGIVAGDGRRLGADRSLTGSDGSCALSLRIGQNEQSWNISCRSGRCGGRAAQKYVAALL